MYMSAQPLPLEAFGMGIDVTKVTFLSHILSFFIDKMCFYGYMATRIPFIKTYATPHELVQLLKTRGMEITDEEKALHNLSHIGYYRLSAYMYPLLSIPKEQHLFKQGVTFGKVMFRAYNTDNQLIIDTVLVSYEICR